MYFSEVQPTDQKEYFCFVTLATPRNYRMNTKQPPMVINKGIWLIVIEQSEYKEAIHMFMYTGKLEKVNHCLFFTSIQCRLTILRMRGSIKFCKRGSNSDFYCLVNEGRREDQYYHSTLKSGPSSAGPFCFIALTLAGPLHNV